MIWLQAVGSLGLVLYLLRRWLLAWATHRYCAFGEVKHAGTSAAARRKGRAVVVGASITGILAGEPDKPEKATAFQADAFDVFQLECVLITTNKSSLSTQKTAVSIHQSSASESNSMISCTVSCFTYQLKVQSVLTFLFHSLSRLDVPGSLETLPFFPSRT